MNILAVILVSFCLCFFLERSFPGWKLPPVKTWPIRVLAVNGVQLGVVLLAGVSWEKWAQGTSLLHLSDHMSPVAGGLFAYLIATFVFYWWHRLRHESDFLWLHFHQIHHSPQRLEVITSFYKHPLEMVVNSIIGSLLVYVLLGLNPEAAGIYTLATALGEFFYHTSCKTPRWVGYFFQRPEMHRIHHQYGYHKNNYGDIVWWDMIFGTYENPKEFNDRCGFDQTPEAPKEQSLFKMLAFHDVHKTIPRKVMASIWVVVSIFSIILGTLVFSRPASACTTFSRTLSQEGFVVAKNFDWFSGDGVIVASPAGLEKHSFYLKEKKWQSRYGTVIFSPFGPGLPASGMNEKGLVVEVLLDFDSEKSVQQKNPWANLEWAQYALDSFGTLEEVIRFAKNQPFDQLLLPVHFFVCDRAQSCAVIESRNQQVVITTGVDLKVAALANRGWKNDFSRSQSFEHRTLGRILPSSWSSSFRFGRVVRELENLPAKSGSIPQVYQILNAARLGAMTQWQLIWQPEKGRVQWKVKKGNQIHSLNLSEAWKGVQGPRILEINAPHCEVTVSDLTRRMRKNIVSTMRVRVGKVDQDLADRVVKFSLQSIL